MRKGGCAEEGGDAFYSHDGTPCTCGTRAAAAAPGRLRKPSCPTCTPFKLSWLLHMGFHPTLLRALPCGGRLRMLTSEHTLS